MWVLFFGWMLIGVAEGYVLRSKGVATHKAYEGALPELRVEGDGLVRFGTCRRRCVWRTLGRLPESRMIEIRRRLNELKPHRVQRWYSGALCAQIPEYEVRYDGNSGNSFLGSGDICLGGGVENPEARGLIRLLQEQFPK